MKTLFDEQIYRLGNWLYRLDSVDGDRVCFECRRVNCKLWTKGFCFVDEWARDVTDVGDIYEDAV